MKSAQCDKRLAILQAALELIAEQGFHGAPMAMVADRAGGACKAFCVNGSGLWF